jgi:hypothetical protein
MQLSDFYNLHAGETCLIVGIGPNLKLTPPEWFDYPSFSVNTIYKYEGWKPDYWVAVDLRIRNRWHTVKLPEHYKDVAKFIPSPDWDVVPGDFYRFRRRPGFDIFLGGQLPNQRQVMTQWGINYRRVMDAVLQIAWHMGFKTMLMIGIDHNPANRLAHFWGDNSWDVANSFIWEERGMEECRRTMNDVTMLNISENTYLPESVIPRDDWQKWRNK